jgi:hypothetical protein
MDGLYSRIGPRICIAAPDWVKQSSAEADSDPQSPILLTVLTVLTLFSADLWILITLVPARPSRLKIIWKAFEETSAPDASARPGRADF